MDRIQKANFVHDRSDAEMMREYNERLARVLRQGFLKWHKAGKIDDKELDLWMQFIENHILHFQTREEWINWVDQFMESLKARTVNSDGADEKNCSTGGNGPFPAARIPREAKGV